MHTAQEYRDILQKILSQAEQMINKLPSTYAARGQEVIDFLTAYGCQGRPDNQTGSFLIGSWLNRPEAPTDKHAGVTIVPCFSDDTPPVERPSQNQGIIPGRCLYKDQVIILYDIDHWSLPELALTLLHEARHARHRLSLKLTALPPLDEDALHETNTWIFTLNVLTAWGDKTWEDAVQQEIAWLTERQPLRSGPDRIQYIMSPHYWPELDQIFSPTNHEPVQIARRRMVSIQANMEYWPQVSPAFQPQQICHSLITLFYQQRDTFPLF